MNTWRKLRALSFGEAFLLVEAGTLLLLVWVGLRVLPYRWLRRLHGDESAARNPSPAATSGTPARISWALRAMAARLPGKMTCLIQALAAQAMLRRRGFRSELRIGVAGRDPEGQ